MSWWCSATGQAWTWTWQPFPGVWLFVLLILGSYVLLRRKAMAAGVAWPLIRDTSFITGAILIWAALDWPIGPLGAGYLVTVHTLQYLLLGLLAPPFLLMGCPPEAWQQLARNPAWRRSLNFAARPLPAFLLFNVVLLVTHLPGVVDTLMPSQLGSFVFDMAWLGAGLVLWWPVIAPAGLSRMSEPVRMGYLFGATLIPTIPAAFLTFASYPVYALYELAPPVMDIAARTDQQAAGLLMKVAGDLILLVAIAIVFFRWSASEHKADDAERLRRTSLSRPASV